MQTNIVPGGVLPLGKNESGHNTPDKPAAPVKDGKAQ
jgi:hypothetical protein